LNDFGFGSAGLTAADFEIGDKVVQLGFPPVRVDIVTSITGVSWEELFLEGLKERTETFEFTISGVSNLYRIKGFWEEKRSR